MRYSGFGKNSATGWSIQTTQGETNLRRSGELTRAEMLPKALKYFDSIRGFHDLSLKFEEAAHPNEYGWTLEMRYQVHLASCLWDERVAEAQTARSSRPQRGSDRGEEAQRATLREHPNRARQSPPSPSLAHPPGRPCRRLTCNPPPN